MAIPGSPFKSGRTSKEKALQRMKHYCGYQERSHGEVKQKLYALGLYKNEVEEVISDLIQEQYLNEERFAVQFASGKFRIKGWGKQKIQYELKQKGISAYCINKALQSVEATEYQNAFSRQAKKKWASLKGEKNIFARKTKWRNYLLQRGFEPALINTYSFPEEPGER